MLSDISRLQRLSDKRAVGYRERAGAAYFQKKKIGFTISSGKGGYLYKDGKYILENIIIITLVGDQGIDIFRLAKNLSMFLNQEASLVMKHTVEKRYM